MSAIVAHEQSRLRRLSGAYPIVVCPYPYLAPWVRGIPGNRLVHYNLDEYAFYEPLRFERIRRLESELVERARLTICLSAHQVDVMRARYPAIASRIRHLPLGVVEDFLNTSLESPSLPSAVGYVGNLTNRIDWQLVARVAERLPEVRFHIIGRLDRSEVGITDSAWRERRKRALGLPNVIYEGEVLQEHVREHYWRYAVNWMPYDKEHGFNIAACPTKIMDALASGRPFLSTDIPEARLYPEHIHIAGTADEAVSILRLLLSGKHPHNVRAQVEFAALHTWPHRAKLFLELLDGTAS
jgi:glycosyltransferase involved in cell wall biosynthesis